MSDPSVPDPFSCGRTQSERRRRLALAGGFRLLRSSGIDRLDALAHAVGRGSAGPDGTRLSSANVSLKRRSPFIHGKIIANLDVLRAKRFRQCKEIVNLHEWRAHMVERKSDAIHCYFPQVRRIG